mgnify:CR=1 FL=1
MSATNIVADVATLTTIPEKTLNRLNKKTIYAICEAIHENQINDTDISELFIGIGTLYIKHSGDQIKYHFEPSDNLDKAIRQLIEDGVNPMDTLTTDALYKKFTDIYKDLC